MTTPKPFTVIGGFLGAGKTTLLNRILREAEGVRFAVLVNDFGDIAIDAALIESHDGRTLSLANGCICCSMSNGFVTAMVDLMQSPDRFDHIVVETSGVSEPDRIMDFARIDRELAPDGTIILVDAASFASQFADPKLTEILQKQIDSADLLVINKTDLSSPALLENLRSTLARIAPDVPKITVRDAAVPLPLLLGMDANSETGDETSRAMEANPHEHAHRHEHAENLFHTVTLEPRQPLERKTFEAFVAALPSHVLRGKGFVRLVDGTYLWQKAGANSTLVPAPDASPENSLLVLIGTEPLEGIDAVAILI